MVGVRNVLVMRATHFWSLFMFGRGYFTIVLVARHAIPALLLIDDVDFIWSAERKILLCVCVCW